LFGGDRERADALGQLRGDLERFQVVCKRKSEIGVRATVADVDIAAAIQVQQVVAEILERVCKHGINGR
jgi:hypothetical protein